MSHASRTNRNRGSQDRAEFASMLADRVHRAGEPTRPEYHDETFSLVATAGKVARLGNIYEEYKSSTRRGREGLLRDWIRTWFRSELRIPASLEEARSDLLPVIERRGTHECDLLEQRAGGGPALPRQVIAEDHAVGVAFDWPECIAYPREEQFASWGVGLDDVLDPAIGNLRSISREGLQQTAPGFWESSWRDSYDASRLLLTDLIQDCDVEGSHVAMVPHRNTLIVTGSEDVEGLERMASVVEGMIGIPRFLSGIAVILEGEEWHPFDLEESPLARRIQALRHLTLAKDYARQRHLLTGLYSREGQDAFVANILINRECESATTSIWGEGITTLLPRTQLVGFVSSNLERREVTVHGTGEWDRVREVVGDLMIPLGLYPERYRVASFPTPEQLDAIKGDGPDLLARFQSREA